jgi:hypothetical protein
MKGFQKTVWQELLIIFIFSMLIMGIWFWYDGIISSIENEDLPKKHFVTD